MGGGCIRISPFMDPRCELPGTDSRSPCRMPTKLAFDVPFVVPRSKPSMSATGELLIPRFRATAYSEGLTQSIFHLVHPRPLSASIPVQPRHFLPLDRQRRGFLRRGLARLGGDHRCSGIPRTRRRRLACMRAPHAGLATVSARRPDRITLQLSLPGRQYSS